MIIYKAHCFHDMTVEEGNLYLADMLRDGDMVDSDQHEFLTELADSDGEFTMEIQDLLHPQGLCIEFYNYGQSCVIGHIESVAKYFDNLGA